MDERSDEMIASKVYPKDSFDRFGDDLCEVLLSYLSLEDRFRSECVAKQWQRLIFTTQTELIYDSESNYKLNIESLKCVLKKCPNIATIEMNGFINRSIKLVFDLVIKHCNCLHTFDVSYFTANFNPDKKFTVYIVNKFFAKFAKQLKVFRLSVDINDNIKQTIVQNMKLCHNITSGIIKNEVFVDKYKNQLKVLNMFFYEDVDVDGDKLVNTISQMHQLIALHFGGCKLFPVTHLSPIGLQLKQLKCLSFSFYFDLIPNDWTLMLKIIGKDFKQLKRLSFNIDGNLPMNSLICKRLTHLTIKIRDYDIKDEFWSTIHTNQPKLQYINVRQNDITDSVLNGLSLVPKLRYIKLKGSEKYSQIGLKNLMDKSSKAIHKGIHRRHYYPDND